MLVRFSVENYRSFKDRQVFSMVAGKHTRHNDQIIPLNGKRLLKVGVLYGANAAGKSNLIKAINFGMNVALNELSSGKIINRNFRIDKECLTKPGIFQYDFWTNGHFYSYGFAISYLEAKFISEWLYIIDGDKEFVVFERNNQDPITTDIKFANAEDEQKFHIYADDVVSEKSFLSEIVSHKLSKINEFEPFFDVEKWFNSLIIIFPQTKINNFRQFLTSDTLESMGKLLNYFDTGIDSLFGKEKTVEDALGFLPDDLRDEIKNDVLEAFNREENQSNLDSVELTIANRRFNFSKNKDGEITVAQFMMNHGNPDDLFELADESDGTRRLFDLLPLYKKGNQNFIILVDELDRSFHTKLTIEFIQKFIDKTSGASTQLIVTLHDSNVMNLNLLRQDEIWFVERQEDHSSKLYSLNQYKERFDHSVAKDYLLGRYGSIPIFGIDPWEDEEE
jgi:AAA15 family ATPase/GTPase